MADYITANRDAQPGVVSVLNYLRSIGGKRIITGQHTQSLGMEELHHIKSITGKEPALLGFELLSYSPNINYLDSDDPCLDEVTDNLGTLRRAWEWAEKGGLLTFTWHWFSPLGGRSKSFYAENTDFDAEKAATEGTPEYRAFISDMDMMAGLLRPFCDAGIPILWRPFHESDGTWFWWGAKGGEVASRLYRIMFDRYTKVHKLTNLIWVWNSPVRSHYPGDEYVDIVSRDIYPGEHIHTAMSKEYEELVDGTSAEKIAALAETGVLPDIDEMLEKGVCWTYYMTWSHEFCLTEQYSSFEQLKKVYGHKASISREDLPKLWNI